MRVTIPGRVHESIGHPQSFLAAGITPPQEHHVGRGYQAVYPDVTAEQAEQIISALRARGEALVQRGSSFDNLLANDCFDTASRIREHQIRATLAV